MTKTQIRFRLRRIDRDMAFLFMNAPFTMSASDVEKVQKMCQKYANKANVKL